MAIQPHEIPTGEFLMIGPDAFAFEPDNSLAAGSDPFDNQLLGLAGRKSGLDEDEEEEEEDDLVADDDEDDDLEDDDDEDLEDDDDDDLEDEEEDDDEDDDDEEDEEEDEDEVKPLKVKTT